MNAGCVSPELPWTLHFRAPSLGQLSATDGNTNYYIRYHFFQEAYPDFYHEVGGAPVSSECCSCLNHKAHRALRVSEGAVNCMGVPVPRARPGPHGCSAPRMQGASSLLCSERSSSGAFSQLRCRSWTSGLGSQPEATPSALQGVPSTWFLHMEDGAGAG